MESTQKNIRLTDEEIEYLLAQAKKEEIEQHHIEEIIGQHFYLPLPSDSDSMLKAKRWGSKHIYSRIEELENANKALQDA